MRKELGVVVIVLVFLVGIGATLSFAQQKQAPDRATVERERAKEGQPGPEGNFRFEFERELQGPPDGMPPPGMPGDFVFIANEMNFGGKVVKGAPYSAQAVTESVQNLSDGNRIVNKSTAAIYRDSEGRTRREQTLRTIGGFANGGDAPQTVFINDPVAGTSYTLDPRSRTARKMPPMNFKFEFRVPGPPGEKGEKGEKEERRELPPGTPPMGRVERQQIEISQTDMLMTGGPGPETRFVWGWGNHVAKDEALGKQNIEGVEAEGTRSTTTIPAGEIGNERAIEIVNERWYSTELQTTVMTRHSDPRFGETTYRLTNIDRSEPAKSLFEVPADYTIKTRPLGHGEGAGFATGGGTGAVTLHRTIDGTVGEILNGRAITLPKPRYPQVAKAARATGNVTVNITIDEEGNVTAAKAVSGHPLLQATSVEAARNAKFSPSKVSGQAVKVHGVLVFAFPGESGQSSKENEW